MRTPSLSALALLFSSVEGQLLPTVDEEQKCRVLSLSGGGAKGAYEIGAMHYILNNLEAPHNQYDVISGVSVGAINALGYSRFAKGEEKAADEEMMRLWA